MASRIRVLIVEDNEDAREMYAEFLNIHDLEVHTAADGLAGLEMARRLRPDVVVLDLSLPKLDGASVLREIRNAPVIGRTPVITCSASMDRTRLDELMRIGANAVLEKPCLPNELEEAIRIAYEKSQ